MPPQPRTPALARRRFLEIGGLATLGLTTGLLRPLAAPARAALPSATAAERVLTLRNTHTGEVGRCAYWSGGRYLAASLAEVDRLLRDHRRGEVHPIDPQLLDLLHDLADELDATPDFEIVSGYRSPRTNAALRQRGQGVARGSYHMQGKAVDLRLAGVDIGRVHRAALALGRGGVGLYSGPGFVHVDTGPVRSW